MNTHPLTDRSDDLVTAWLNLYQLRTGDVILLGGKRALIGDVLPAGDAPGAPLSVEYEWEDEDGWGWHGILTLPGSARFEALR